MSYTVLENGDILIRPAPAASRKSREQSLRERLWRRDPCCVWCGFLFVDPHFGTIEHLHFKSLGGRNSMENCRLACSRCNSLRDRWYTRALKARGKLRGGQTSKRKKYNRVWPDGQTTAKVVMIRGAKVRVTVY